MSKKDDAWFETQVIDNDDLTFMQKLKIFWKYIMNEVEKIRNGGEG